MNFPHASSPPSFRRGHFAPVSGERTAENLKVRGSIPKELNGLYVRNNHNPRADEHPANYFLGTGMLHGVRLREGRAEWYRNRWVDTALLRGKPRYRANGSVDLEVSTAGTHIVSLGGKLLALWEGGYPYEVTRELDTVGVFNFDGRLTTPMCAHPHRDPRTGQLHFFGCGFDERLLTYYVASPSGELVYEQSIPIARPSFIHDFFVTPNYVVWHEPPVAFDAQSKSHFPFEWDQAYRSRFGLLKRDGGGLTWFACDPSLIVHFANAYEDSQGRVVVEAPNFQLDDYRTLQTWAVGGMRDGNSIEGVPLTRWIIDPAAGTVSQSALDDGLVEFPQINEAVAGELHRYVYATGYLYRGGNGAIIKYDSQTGKRSVFAEGSGRMPSEAIFVGAQDAKSEDDGWLLTHVSDLESNSSEFLILDATDLEAPPVAVVELPWRIPISIHGSWIPDSVSA